MEIPGKARVVALALGLGIAPITIIQPTMVSAQEAQPQPFAISMAPVVLAEPEIETPFEITVGPEAQVPRQSYVRVRGLPLAARLSEGHVILPGSWAIPLGALKSLKVMAPISASGRTEITVSVLNVDGSVLAEAKSSLVVAPAWLLGSSAGRNKEPARTPPAIQTPAVVANVVPDVAAPPAAPVTMAAPAPAAPTPVARAAPPAPPPAQTAAKAPSPAPVASLPPPAAAPPAAPAPAQPQVAARSPAAPAVPAPVASPRLLTPQEAERAGRLLFQGDNYRNQGNIAAARQFYRRAADMGLALAAMQLAASYDAAELARLNVQGGIDPDPVEARKWYERAKELGSPDAEARIARLATAPKR